MAVVKVATLATMLCAKNTVADPTLPSPPSRPVWRPVAVNVEWPPPPVLPVALGYGSVFLVVTHVDQMLYVHGGGGGRSLTCSEGAWRGWSWLAGWLA